MSQQDLSRRREDLAERVAQSQFDLGGLAYEMAIRDHFRLDVLVRRAAALQALDAELGEVERLVAMQESATAGACSGCGALHGRAAVFCWQCGAGLVARTSGSTSAPAPAPDASAARTPLAKH